ASRGHRDLSRALGKEIHLFAVEAVQRPRRRRGLPAFLLERDARRERPPCPHFQELQDQRPGRLPEIETGHRDETLIPCRETAGDECCGPLAIVGVEEPTAGERRRIFIGLAESELPGPRRVISYGNRPEGVVGAAGVGAREK